MIDLDFSRCRSVWVPPTDEQEGFWSPPPEHVREGVREIVAHPYYINGDDMGLMKTAQALIAAQFMHDANVIDRMIVVAPAELRRSVWFDQGIGQIAEQAFDDKLLLVSDFHQSIRQWRRGPETAREFRVICANYEYIRRQENLEALLQYCGPKTFLVLDESSAVRGPDSAQTEACMLLRWQGRRRRDGSLRPVMGAPRCGRILELNGTFIAESPMDAFSQGNLLHPSILDCKYKSQYKARYAINTIVRGAGGRVLRNPRTGKPLEVVDGWTPEGVADIQRRFAPYIIRREAKDVGINFALPPVALEVTLTKETWAHYTSMRDQMVVWLEKGVIHARQAGVKTMRLAQITSGFLGGLEDPMVDPDDEVPDVWFDGLSEPISKGEVDRQEHRLYHPQPSVVEVGREKLDHALAWHRDQLRREPDMKLLTWCRFVPELRRYLAEVRALTPEVGAACGSSVLGLGKRVEREQALRMLHPKTTPQGACTVGATQGTGAMGLNFTACHTVLDVSYDFSALKKKQGDARTNRTGQTRPVSYFYLIAVGPRGQKTIDHHIYMERLGKIQVNDLTTAGWVRLLREE